MGGANAHPVASLYEFDSYKPAPRNAVSLLASMANMKSTSLWLVRWKTTLQMQEGLTRHDIACKVNAAMHEEASLLGSLIFE